MRRSDVLILFFRRIAAGIYDSPQNWQHDISLNSIILATACKHFKGNIIMDNKTLFHKRKTARSPSFAKIHLTRFHCWPSSAEMISQQSRSARLDGEKDVTRCVAHIHKMTPSSPATNCVPRGHCCRRKLAAARFYNLFNLAGPNYFYMYSYLLVGRSALTFYAPHAPLEIYLVINQNSSSAALWCRPLFLYVVVVVLTRTNEPSQIINSKDPGSDH